MNAITTDSYRILVIDDEKSIRRLLDKELAASEREIILTGSAKEAVDIATVKDIDVIIMDLRLPDTTDLDLLITMKANVRHAEIIMITGHGDVDTAVRAMKYGVCDFIQKPFDLDELDILVEKAHQRAQLSRKKASLQGPQRHEETVQLIGCSKAIQHIRFMVKKVAPASISVLLTGESGVGKDVVAHMIHEQSTRADKEIVIKNCATLQKDLARSELFGHAQGAFTGADKDYEGLLAHAEKSTLFLDEIGELPLVVQASLLRILETRRYRRVGEKQERQVDVRFIFATNRHLFEGDDGERFNEAFRNRINAFQIEIPALRERKEDLPLLVDFFLARATTQGHHYSIEEEAMRLIFAYHWPGNIRELRNVIERATILAENNLITPTCLPRELLGSLENTSDNQLSLEKVEQDHILKILHFYNGNRQKTADILGISRKTLYRKLSKFGVE